MRFSRSLPAAGRRRARRQGSRVIPFLPDTVTHLYGVCAELGFLRTNVAAGRVTFQDGEGVARCFSVATDIVREIHPHDFTPIGEAAEVGEGDQVEVFRAL